MSRLSNRLRILIVDDDHVIALLHKNQLRPLEQVPVICHNGEEALLLLKEDPNPEKHFLVLLDINMPVMNGWEFLESLQKLPFKERVYVIVVTSSVERHDFHRALEYAEVIGFCRKPLGTEAIAEIRKLQELRPFFLPTWFSR